MLRGREARRSLAEVDILVCFDGWLETGLDWRGSCDGGEVSITLLGTHG